MTDQPTLYMLIGVPGSGKSTWVAKQQWASNCVLLSTDKFIDAYALSLGKTYNDVFTDYIKTATQMLSKLAITTTVAETSAIWDQTNLSIKSRRDKIKLFLGYKRIAVVFPTPEMDELTNRLASRPGKHISNKVITSMINSFQMPTTEEGFDEIWYT